MIVELFPSISHPLLFLKEFRMAIQEVSQLGQLKLLQSVPYEPLFWQEIIDGLIIELFLGIYIKTDSGKIARGVGVGKVKFS